jgi:transcriptional regulator with XRE-family HTH domain
VAPPKRRSRQSTESRQKLTADQVVADQVKTLRERHGISQQRLADTLGWTQSAVARLENGRRTISVSDLLALAWALDVAPVYLLAGSFQTGDVPIHETLRVPPQHMRKWIRGGEPLPGSNYRAYFENMPDDEWAERYGPVEQQRHEAAAVYEQAEELLESGASRRPGHEDSEISPEREAELAEERRLRSTQLAAATRAKKRANRARKEKDDAS